MAYGTFVYAIPLLLNFLPLTVMHAGTVPSFSILDFRSATRKTSCKPEQQPLLLAKSVTLLMVVQLSIVSHRRFLPSVSIAVFPACVLAAEGPKRDSRPFRNI
jgi:hypothetical protein